MTLIIKKKLLMISHLIPPFPEWKKVRLVFQNFRFNLPPFPVRNEFSDQSQLLLFERD